MPAPTVTVTVGDTPRLIAFNLERLLAIEEITGMTLAANLAEFASLAPDFRIEPGQDLTPEQLVKLQTIATKFSLTRCVRFVAACLGMDVAHASAAIPVERVRPIFADLLPPFVEAIRQLNGSADAGPPKAPSAD